MSTYTVQIKKQNTIITFNANSNINYDNILWWELSKLVKILKKEFTSNEDLIQEIENNSGYFKMGTADHTDLVIDLDQNTMDKPMVPLYKFDEVNPANCCIALRKEGNNYFAIYDEDEQYLMNKVSFAKLALLNKDQVTLDEFIEIADFINTLTENDESDYVLNDQLVLRFNNI